ncbi:MAG: sensor histidine kinase [Gemmatimonadales bacterium]|nr:MAG: sensor histidine kinase [Gemmatimonadales bacterium]
MSRSRWTGILALLFVALLGWYLLYTERVINVFRDDAATLTRMFAEVQTGMASQDPLRADEALVNLQRIIVESGVPLVLAGPGDTIQSAVNLPFEADLASPEGQLRVREFTGRLAERNPPVAQTDESFIFYGDPPELQRLRWIPWLQASGLLLTFLIGIVVIRSQRKADEDRAWTAMARELAHQLGTPISSLQGWLELLRLGPDRRPGGLSEEEIAREIAQDLERLERVSRRFELIGRDTELEALALDEVVRSMEGYLRSRIPRLGAGVRLDVEMERSLPPIRGNAVLLVWALENLVKNSLDALAGKGGNITIEAFADDGGHVVLQVADDGPGVDPAVRDRLFDPGVSTKSAGWGVGLSLTRRIVQRIHGGTIELHQTGSEGTVFRIRLPVATPEQS